jgi:hypothetical protein
VNPQGNPKSLVAAQHGNRNAVKTGVFSADLVASRVEETERALAPLDAEELISDVLKSEIARFLVLRDAMDQTLEEDGLRGRGGQARSMISLRLRLNTRLLKTVEQYGSRSHPPALDSARNDHDGPPCNVLEEIALRHQQKSLDLITLDQFDPARFLATIVESDDPSVDISDQIRAHTMLTRWRAGRSTHCACFSTRAARDGAEFRGWMDELREAGLSPDEDDTEVGEQVRALARGERLEPRMMYAKTAAAIEAVVRAAAENAGLPPRNGTQPDENMDARDARLWQRMLSVDVRISLRQRLKAFDALDKASAFRRCTCGGPQPKRQLWEEKFDSTLAYIVRLVAGRHYRAAAAAVEFPETYLAVRDAIDAAIRSVPETGH